MTVVKHLALLVGVFVGSAVFQLQNLSEIITNSVWQKCEEKHAFSEIYLKILTHMKFLEELTV